VLLALALLCAGAASARAASFGVKEGSFKASISTLGGESFTRAAGHPARVSAAFDLREGSGEELQSATLGLPVGLVIDPRAVAHPCGRAAFEGAAGPERECAAESVAGTDLLGLEGQPGAVEASVWLLQAPEGLPLELGVYLPAAHGHPARRLYMQGRINWSSDYHESLELRVPVGEPEALRLVRSTLTLEDAAAHPGLFTLPGGCAASTAWQLSVQSSAGHAEEAAVSTVSGLTGCGEVPFAPALLASAETWAHDEPDGLTVTATDPQVSATIASADIAAERLLLPAGLTLELPGASGLKSCSAAQAALGQRSAFACPAASQLASVSIQAPFLPEALSGGVYLASADGGPVTGASAANPQYAVYLDAESARDGLTVRLSGVITPDPSSGRLELTFTGAPQLPLSELTLTFAGGPSALLANPLVCGASRVEGLLTQYATAAATAVSAPFETSGCPNPLPFAPSQSVLESSTRAGAATTFTLRIARADGQQYLSALKTVLPEGLAARIAGVLPCEEPQAAAGACPSESRIGSASIEAGAGAMPYPLHGSAYLTGASVGSPFGIELAVPAVVGPLNLGPIVALAKVRVDADSGQMTLEGTLPRIVKGIPLRMRSLGVTIDRKGFLYEPSACGRFHTSSTLSPFTPGTALEQPAAGLSSPLTIADCGALAFKPSFVASTSANASAAMGASLEATLSVPAGNSAVRSMALSLPRLLTLRPGALAQACTESTFATDPNACPPGSIVGSARAVNLLAGALSGPAILVAHPGASSPGLDLVLESGGVRLLVHGSTRTADHVTSVEFPSTPDVPLTQLTLNLSMGPHSALVPLAGTCTLALRMPTTILSWSGKTFKQKTAVTPAGCGVRIVGHKVIGGTAYLTVQTYSAGRISGSGRYLSTVFRHLPSAKSAAALLVPLNRRGRSSRGPLRIRVRVGFVPTKGGAKSQAFITLSFP